MEQHSAYLPLLLVTALAALVPVLASRIPHIPIVVGEILAGMIIGHAGFNLVPGHPSLKFLAEFGFTFLMFLSGLEVDLRVLSTDPRAPRPAFFMRPIPLALLMLAGTMILAIGSSFALKLWGMASDPLLMGLILSTTSLGIVLPVLKEHHLLAQRYGQYLLIAATVADFLTLLFLTAVIAASSHGLELDLLLVFVLLAAFALVARMAHRFSSVPILQRLVDELSHATAQLRVRGALALMVAWVVLADALGAEVILGAFLAGAVVGLMADVGETHLRVKLDAIGFGFFIPIFFINVGIEFNLDALSHSTHALALVPLLVGVAYLVKLLPALLLQRIFGWREALAGGFLLSSRLSLIIAASAIALQVGAVDEATNAAIILVAVVTCTVSPWFFSHLHRKPKERPHRSGIIITGGSQLSLLLMRRLHHAGEKATLVSRDVPGLEELRKRGKRVLVGEADQESVLAEAGARNAEALVSLYANPKSCQRVCALARQTFDIPLVVAMAHTMDDAQRLQELGVRVIQPFIATAVAIEGALRFPTAFDVLVDQDDDVEIGEAVLRNRDLVGLPLRRLELPGNALVLSLQRDGATMVPHGNSVVERGDHLALIGDPQSVQAAIEHLSALQEETST
ncbi:MAG: cation:proton antiporter [Deltaproteobacteria bacterium]|nr:cation:proton antiporter [Deltaproteobacteria bacterium]